MKSEKVERRALTDADKVRMARLRFGADNNGRFRSIDEVAALEGRNVAVVSRAITSAFQEGLVAIQATEAPRALRLPDLERRLRERFSQLRGAIVLDPGVTDSGSDLAEGDRQHRQLGMAMADLLATGPLFRDEDVIGLGSGRAVFYTVDALARNFPLPVKDVTIGSLTGSVYARDHSGALKLIYDADNHTASLASCFRSKVNLELISHPIAFRTEELDKVRKRTWLDDAKWKLLRPTHALLGVGVLAEGHRLFQELRAEDKNSWLAPIMGPVADLVDLSTEISLTVSDYLPVMDFCNRFFFVEPPAGVTIPPKLGSGIHRKIRELNQHLLTISEEQLRSIETLILVAGGRRKAPAIGQLLLDGGAKAYKIRYLCTDRDVATAILAM